jgi:hypothetical protein
MSVAEAIDPTEVKYSPLSLVDESGRVFFWRGRVWRGVTAAAEAEMRARFDSGLVAALVQRGLMPPCAISTACLAPFAIVVEHARLPVATMPYEWSYAMLRAAAECVLETNEVANAHGWELKDCHGFNVLFDGPLPRYVDLGSFVRRRPGQRGWSGLEEFVRFYDYPLRVWRAGDGYTARRWLAAADNVPYESYLLYRHPLLRRLGGVKTLGRFMRGWHQFRRITGTEEEKFTRRLSPRRAAFALWLRRQSWLPAQTVNYPRLRRRVTGRERRWLGSLWSEYQAGFDVAPTPRFERIMEIVRELRPHSVLELGGNQGWLSHQLLARGIAPQVVCTDGDEEAVDHAYRDAARRRSGLHTAVLDFVFPMATAFHLPPAERFAADVVLALAVSHHVLLTQRVAADRFFSAVGACARRHVLIEFMPLGLWDGKSAPPVPDWYNVNWFREHFTRHFQLVREETLEPNRVLFVGSRLNAG